MDWRFFGGARRASLAEGGTGVAPLERPREVKMTKEEVEDGQEVVIDPAITIWAARPYGAAPT